MVVVGIAYVSVMFVAFCTFVGAVLCNNEPDDDDDGDDNEEDVETV